MTSKEPERKKAKRVLSKSGGEERCCLGHACQCFLGDPEFTNNFLDSTPEYEWEGQRSILPKSLVKQLGMWKETGESRRPIVCPGAIDIYSLIALNDKTELTPQEIGEYLESAIEGGVDTPFKPLSDYEE